MTDPISSSGSMGPVQATVPGLAVSKSAAGSTEPAAVSGTDTPRTTAAVGQDTPSRLMELATQAMEQQKAKQPSLEEAASTFREYLKALPSNLQFRADQESGYYTFKVINPVTQEVIRKFPPDEVLEMAKRIKEQLANKGAGILLDEKL